MNLWLLVSCLLLLLPSLTAARTNLRHNNGRTTRNLGLPTTGSTSAEEFVDQCTAHLLSSDTVADGLISQEEFSRFLSDLCVGLQMCEEGTSIQFGNLSVELQLAFVSFLCNEPTESEREECLSELKEMGISFGYDVNDEEDAEVLETEIQQLCAQAYLFAMRSGLLPPTLAPSVAPPTLAPAASPTDETGVPTDTVPTTGDNDPNGGGTPISARNDSVSTGLIVGVSIAGVVLLLAVAMFVSRRRKRRRGVSQEKYVATPIDVAGDESIFTEDSAAFKYIPKKMGDSFHSARSAASGSAKSRSSSSSGKMPPKDVVATGVKSRSIAQFDPGNAAAAIALGIDGRIIRRGSESSSHRSSSPASLETGKHDKITSLNDAIEIGDWDKVAALAGGLASDSEDVSTISDYSSAREQLSHRSSVSSLNSGDEERAAQIHEMVERNDWSGVATAAQFFSSSSKSLGTSGTDTVEVESPKRSFLDFVTGRRNAPSAAATAAIVPVAADLLDRDSEESDAVANVGVPEDTPSVADAGPNITMDTQSSSSHEESQQVEHTSKSKKRSKRWFGRLSRTSKKDAQLKSRGLKGEDRSSETLQAELNAAVDRGDWNTVEEISAKLDSPGSPSVSSQTAERGSPAKQDVSDEGVLGAASLASMKKKPAKRPGESPIATKRKEIDDAVSRGDWDAVERLTSQLLNTKPSPLPKDIMADTLMDRTPSSKSTGEVRSPFRDTPSSSEWSGSPMEKEVRSEKLRKLIKAKDWKGVNVLSGIYDMEAKGALPPSFASLSNDSNENPTFARGWLLGGTSNASTPNDSASESGSPRRRPPPSPSTSTSTNNSAELREFERLVNAKDWKGLAAFAGAEEETVGDDDGTLLPRNLFKIDPLAPAKPPPENVREEEHVELRHTDGPQQWEKEESDTESIHGAPLLIPYWQKKVDKYSSPDRTSEKKSKDDKSSKSNDKE